MTAFSTVVQTAIYEQLTREITVRYPDAINSMPSPFDPEGWYGPTTDTEGTITNTVIENPSGQAFMGFVEMTSVGNFILNRVDDFTVIAGESVFLSILIKDAGDPIDLAFQFTDGTGPNASEETRFSETGQIITTNPNLNTLVTTLNDGFLLIQVEYPNMQATNDLTGIFYMRSAPIGSEFLVQASFMGIADDFPAEYYVGGELFDPSGDPIPVFDDVQQAIEAGDSTSFPYVTIGEDVFTDTSTDTELMGLVSITIHTWSRTAGRAETKKIQGLVYDALNRVNLVQSGYKFVNINNVSSQSNLESDGFTRHGVQTFNLIIEEL